jgi:uncharacterized protein YyaL (SSP411 family)
VRLREDPAAILSPYLRDHADNPVDWWAWGPEPFAAAVRRDVPVLLSVGYAACHWCHVMAAESFEDPAIGELINEHFIAIKVDREERPDVDAVYMRATQMLTGRGGWPMTVFLDPSGRPFHAGTYFPPVDGPGGPSFRSVLTAVHQAWSDRRTRVAEVADQVAQALRQADATGPARPVVLADPAVLSAVAEPGGGASWPDTADAAALAIAERWFDPVDGGFGGAPKFPMAPVLEFLLRHHARTGEPASLRVVATTCRGMARGGLHDQLAGGFARYSVDRHWTVPHFEKMLFDNAQLARVYLHWWRATGDPTARRIARSTCEFLLQDLRTGQGGFASALDADSAPVLPGQQREGAHYVWTPEQLRDVLGPQQAERAAQWLGVTAEGTFEHGASVLQLRTDPPAEQWEPVRQALLAARRARPAPARDDKVVTAWNGMAVAALAEAGALLAEPALLTAAADCARLLLDLHRPPGGGGRLVRLSRDGVAGSAPAVLEDYGALAEGLLVLSSCTGGTAWLDAAGELLMLARQEFGDGSGGFYEAPAGLITRPRDPTDNATPSGATSVTGALLTYAALTGDQAARRAAEAAMAQQLDHPAAEQPLFFGHGLAVLEAMIAGPLEVAVIGEPLGPLHRAALLGTSPGLAVAVGAAGTEHPALLARRTGLAGRPAAYVCRDGVCRLPTDDAAALADLIGRSGAG